MNKGFQTIQEQFVDFHAKHPEVYAELCTTARRLKAKGYRKIGIAPLWEWLRLTMYLNHSGNTHWEYRFPNDYRAHLREMERERACAGPSRYWLFPFPIRTMSREELQKL
jgi:hypothetical protein